MRNVMRLSTLTKSILLATSSLIIAGNASAATAAQPVIKNSPKLDTHKGLVIIHNGVLKEQEWSLTGKNEKQAAELTRDADKHNVYYSGPVREANDQQALIIDGTDLSDHYINMSTGGTTSLTMKSGAKADMIEVGNDKAKTNTTINLDNAQLNGQKEDKEYDDKLAGAKLKNKNYMKGAAIWMDPGDNGDVNVVAKNGSIINGSINAKGTGNKNVVLEDSLLINGSIDFRGESVNNVSLKNSDALAGISTVNKTIVANKDAMTLINAKENHVTLDKSAVDGDKTLESSGDSDFFMVNKSNDNGNIIINAGGTAAVDISDSTHKGNMIIAGKKGATIFVTHHADSTGNVIFGKGKNLLTVSDHSTMLGDVMADNTSKTDMVVDNNSSHTGIIAGVQNLSINDHSQVMTSELKDTNIALHDHSKLLTTNLNHSTINMGTNDQFAATNVTGKNSMVVSQFNADTAAGTYTLANMKLAKGATVNTTFANSEQATSARYGAYNNDLQLSTVTTSADNSKNADQQQKVVLAVKRADLANDVKSAIAGLDGAKASAASVTGSIANRMTTLNASNLFYGVHEGANVWGDYLFHNADLKGNTDSRSKLQGVNTGADWTWKLNNGDSLTSGMAIGEIKNKMTHSSVDGNYHNHINGDFYSLYAGWQQALQNNRWSLFANTNVSYGRLDFTANSNNVGASTSGAKEHLSSHYKGNVLNAELRSGINVKVTPSIIVQPYALLGMSKATADGYANSNVKFAKNETRAMYAGVGTRITADVDVKSIKLMPWADVSYTQEFNDKTDIKATAATKAGDYQMNSGKKRKVMAIGAGLNAAVTNNLNLNSGIYTNAGDTSKDVSVRAGINYSF